MPGVLASYCDFCLKVFAVRFVEGRMLLVCSPPNDLVGLQRWQAQHTR